MTLAFEKLHQNNQFLHVLIVLLILVLGTPWWPNSRLARMASLDKRVFFSQMLINVTPTATVMLKHFMIFSVVASWLTLTHFRVYSVTRQIHTVTVSVCFSLYVEFVLESVLCRKPVACWLMISMTILLTSVCKCCSLIMLGIDDVRCLVVKTSLISFGFLKKLSPEFLT